MYGLFTKMGAGAVFSAGLSVLGVTYLCTDSASNNHQHRPAAVAAVQADAALAAGVVASPSSHGPSTNPGNGNAGYGNAGSSNSGPPDRHAADRPAPDHGPADRPPADHGAAAAADLLRTRRAQTSSST